MRRALSFSLLFIATAALAREPVEESALDRWIEAINSSAKELAGCRALAGSLYGDVVVAYNLKTQTWRRTASKSLNGVGDRAAGCVQDALAKRFRQDSRDRAARDELTHTVIIGTPAIVLPPIDKLLPVWRRAHGDEKARGELAKLLPADYQVTKDGCFRTGRESIRNAEYMWLPTAGSWVPRQWDKELAAALGGSIELAMWRKDEMITRGTKGTCLVSFDSSQQSALRTEMDKAGSCWAGGFEDVLLHPHTALPMDVDFTQVATQNGRVCALSKAGEVTCCGRPGATPPKGPFTQLTVGGAFECALDRKGAPTCWGTIAAPPKGPFKKISAEYAHVCGLRADGTIACWGTASEDVMTPPVGVFADVATASHSSCGLHTDGRAECWGEEHREKHPAGRFTRVTADWMHACGLRKDGSVGCWTDDDQSTDSPLAGPMTDIAVGDAFRVCALRKDGSLECTGARPGVGPPPSGTFTQLAGDHDTFCAVGTDHRVACWGEAWPGAWLGDNTWPYTRALGLVKPVADVALELAGRIVDEHGKPLAHVDVVACTEAMPCSSFASELLTSPGAVADLARKDPLDPTKAVLATTGADGRWAITIQHPNPGQSSSGVELLITAAGREVATISGNTQLGDIVLRPASSLDIDLSCGKAPCAGPIRLSFSSSKWVEGAHLEHLAPGSYRIEAITNVGQPGERRGVANIDVAFKSTAKHVKLAATAVGAGASIKGTASLAGRSSKDLIIRSHCDGRAGAPVYRDAKTDANGNFVLRDVGSAPCTVEVSSARSIGVTKVLKVPATGVLVNLREHEPGE